MKEPATFLAALVLAIATVVLALFGATTNVIALRVVLLVVAVLCLAGTGGLIGVGIARLRRSAD